MTKLSFLIVRIREYQLRYETETYNPELNGLLNDSVVFLGFVGDQLEEIKDLLKKGDYND